MSDSLRTSAGDTTWFQHDRFGLFIHFEKKGGRESLFALSG